MRRSYHFLLAGSLAGLALPAVPDSPPAPGVTGVVEGTVRSSDGNPIAAASVITAGGIVASTGPDGRFRLEGLPAGEIQITVRALGFRAAIMTVRVSEGAVTRADFTLTADPLRLDELVTSGVGGRIRGAARAALPRRPEFNTEEYRHIVENAWRSPLRYPLSTFSSDVDAGSYSNIRRFVADGKLPPKDAVRVEEMINYFTYDYPEPGGEHPVSITTEVAPAPWHPTHKLILIGLQTRRIPVADLPPNNLVFLLDVSGSMDNPRKLPLVKAAFRLLVNQLRPQDRVGIVVYAGAAGLVLPSTPGDRKDQIQDAIERLDAGGSTAGAAGIRLAYETARKAFLPEGNNRVILATDGDFNVGTSSDGELARLIEQEREHGIFLTVLGFGMGNLKDSKLELLADKGNGHYAYVDDLLEARKVLVQELGATLLTVAKDVKLQIEFNPRKVAAYRLVGYENRLLADEDFDDDAKDAGELGAGHAVTALYEVVPVGAPLDVKLGSVAPLRYQNGVAAPAGRSSDDWLTVKIRYKSPAGANSRLLSQVVRGERAPSETFRWAAAVAGIGMLLRDSEHKGRGTWTSMLTLARGARGPDREGYRSEFIRVVETAELLASQVAAGTGDRR